MRDFSYVRASSLDDARQRAMQSGAMLLAGGTTLLDLAKCGVAQPSSVIDISYVPGLAQISANSDGVTIGALAKMEDVAGSPGIRADYPVISQSLLLAASPQLRNMATIGGNLLQRTRCPYFRDPATFSACNKRDPGSGCSAIAGVTRNHAVLGTSHACIASYPGDLAVALVALEATIDLGDRKITAEEFFVLPGDTPERETILERGEMVVAVLVRASPLARNSTYLKVRDRQSYEFAAASAAVGLELEADGKTIRDIRVALGGVATKPWRARSVEKALIGKAIDAGTVEKASRLAMEGAVAYGGNQYKIELAPRVVARAILTMGGPA
ncbi:MULTISPECIES: FAD binding domain-containing protein [Rhizobium]|uniref:Aerobic-type carbon monoxide dehydrogenase, middle subunit CoxM/CutM-like protein n=1 Tax=Rhizobium favelukesii TaxID=348824 RepID=W6RRJ9_9HYPH|nr:MULTISPECIES: xanthine dehydrogenase family protein subunit M [Rhizobium]MCS0461695.1 xanthine dehydrogenase family protein subunit M [Rhizobium favelukesii]UFS79245.1 xanthine dehydrogenase family protein subunit M [Rhizobium sp. T136]CDM62775.1 aerobic-type carbon monoxide dehydrogenase, middle subunit CoxM/CutM-like protein [Rhizobium favelukesii]